MLTKKDRSELRTMIANTSPDDRGWAEEWLAKALDDLDSFHETLDNYDWRGLQRDAAKEHSEFADPLDYIARLDEARGGDDK